jgi:RHS repeat-associated protein
MMPAAKHGDPQVGVDIHLCIVPPSPSPVPLPTPHMSMVFDPMDYLPFIGATVTVCGMKRAVAGTSGTVVHIPPGFPFAPKLPDKDDEIFMGSATVVADGDPFSFLGVPVLACQVVGMPSPPRPRRKGGPRAMLLPTVFNLAIPSTVFVGGPPTISLMGMAFKLAFAGLGRLAKSRFAKALGERFRNWRKAKWGHLTPSFLKCKILRAEPVNIVTGAVSVEQEDFILPGLIPIHWTRRYTSDNPRPGACGIGWETPADARLEHDPESGIVLFHHPEGGIAIFPGAPRERGAASAVLELMDGAVLSDEGQDFKVRTKEDRIYRFRKGHAAVAADGSREYPLDVIEDLCGNTLFYERDGQRRLVAIRERAGRRIEIERGSAGFIRQVSLHVPETGFRHVFVEYEQDQAGDLTEVRDALAQPYRFVYDAHHMVRHTDRNGLSFYYEYDKAPGGRRVVRSWGDGGLYAYKFAYLEAAHERRITDSLSHVSVVTLDERGLPIRELDPLGGATIYEYDDAGRTTAIVDQDGHRTEYGYDERGNLLKFTRPDGAVITTEFDAYNKPTRTTDANGADWEHSWDERGLLVKQVSPLGHSTTAEYGADGRIRTFTNPRGAQTRLAFDGLGNLVEIVDALGARSRFRYDALGNVTEYSDPLGHATLFAHDQKSRLTALRSPSGAELRCGYDAEDNLTQLTDENAAVTRFEYWGQGEIARRIQPDGQSISYHYDTEEQLIGVTNQRGETYRLGRDALGRVVQETDYWLQTKSYRYSAGGHIRESSDALRQRTLFWTDPVGRVVKRTRHDLVRNGKAWTEVLTYDANGNVLTFENPDTRVERVYDVEDRLVEERQGPDFGIFNTYDESGNRILRRTVWQGGVPVEGHSVRYAYDLLDEVREITADNHHPIRIERDAFGQIVAERFGSGSQLEIEHDNEGYITRERLRKDAATLFELTYTYDATGNLIQRSDTLFGDDRFVYDANGRITGHASTRSGVRRFENDPAGDRLPTRIVDKAGADGTERDWLREGTIENAVCQFDRAGSLVASGDRNGGLSLRWDADQRLVQSETPEGTVRYGYDGLGRRVHKAGENTFSSFFWDGETLVAEKYGPGPADDPGRRFHLREWIYLPDSFEPVAMIVGEESGESLLHYCNEPNGCPTRMIDASGAVKWAATFGASGDLAALQGRVEDNPIRLQGQYGDVETGLSYNLFRYYAPHLGAYATIDPLRLDGGPNLYALGLNALGWIDPLGLACYIATRDATRGVIKGRKLKNKEALSRIRRGLDVIADTKSEALSLAKRALKGKPMHHTPHGSGRPLFLPHYHPNQHAGSSHVFYP